MYKRQVLVCSTALGAMGVDAPGFAEGLAAATILTVASSWMVPAALALTVRFGTLAGIAVPVLLQLGAGIALYSSAAWFAFPPATTLCAVSPLLGVAPSGVPLEAGEALGAFGWEACLLYTSRKRRRWRCRRCTADRGRGSDPRA